MQDLLKPVLETDFSASIHFGRVFMKPGYGDSIHVVKGDGGICSEDLNAMF